MNKLEQLKRRAQEQANINSRPMAILNLNQYSPLYVIRLWDDSFQGTRELVARLDPAVQS